MEGPPPGQDLVPVDQARYRRDRARVEKGFWDKVRQVIDQVPFVEDAVAAYHCARDPLTPFHVKAVLFGALAYFVLPTDTVPDFMAGLGFTDDAAVMAIAIRTVASAITDEHRERARESLKRPPAT